MLVASSIFVLFFNSKFSTTSRFYADSFVSIFALIWTPHDYEAMYMAPGFYGGEIRKVTFYELSL